MLVLTSLFVAAGGSDESSSATDTSAPEATDTSAPEEATDLRLPEMTTVRMANVPYFGPEYIAIDQGFDEKYNLNIEIELAANLGVPGIQAVAAGQVDTFQSVAFDSWFKSIDAGVDIIGIMSGQISGGEFDVYRYYVRSDSGITSAQDLVGTTMGVAGVGTYGDVPMDLYLKAAGLDPSDVERIAVPPAQIPEALATGQIDVAAAFSNVYANLDANYGDVTEILFRDADVIQSDTFATAYGFSREFIADNPDVVAAFIATIQDGVDFIEQNPEEARQIIADVTDSAIEGLIVPAYPDGLCMDLSLLDEYREILIDLGYLEDGALPNIEDNFTNEFNPACS